MVEAKTRFSCNGRSEVKAFGGRGVQTAGAGQETGGLICLDIQVGICVGPEAATHPLQHLSLSSRHPWQEAPSCSLEAKK